LKTEVGKYKVLHRETTNNVDDVILVVEDLATNERMYLTTGIGDQVYHQGIDELRVLVQGDIIQVESHVKNAIRGYFRKIVSIKIFDKNENPLKFKI
jgi:hypothetical protein